MIKYQQRIIQLVARYVRDTSEAQDVAQEAFIKAYKALPNLEVKVPSILGFIVSQLIRQRLPSSTSTKVLLGNE